MATQFRKPDGSITSNSQEYVEAWCALAHPLCSALGWELQSFDPALRVGPRGTSQSLVLTPDQARALGSALRVAEEARRLRDDGYDGPFMGDAVEPLFAALAEYEREARR